MHALHFKESKSGGKIWQLFPQNIYLFESSGHFIKIKHIGGELIIHQNMIQLTTLLEPYKYFKRVHRSFIISELHIKYVELNRLCLVNNQMIPIGRIYKASFFEKYELAATPQPYLK